MDVVAEFVDEDGDGTIDRKRYYWTLPTMDQRIGFVDEDPTTGTEEWYYFLCDAVGSVIAVIDSSNNIVNRYDYDAFGNLISENSYETVPNRYRFHGREYDEHRGDYYYRHRIYIPEWGSFTSPDPVINLSDPGGAMNYLFCNNNPLIYTDPEGLIAKVVSRNGKKYIVDVELDGTINGVWPMINDLNSQNTTKDYGTGFYTGFVTGTAGVADGLTGGLTEKAREGYGVVFGMDLNYVKEESGYQTGVVSGTVAREFALAAFAGNAAKGLSTAARQARLAGNMGKARYFEFLSSGLMANSSATAFSVSIGSVREAWDGGEWDLKNIQISTGGRVGSILGGGMGAQFSNIYWAGAVGGGTYSTTQQFIDTGKIDTKELVTDIAFSMFFTRIAGSSGKKYNPKQQNALNRWGQGKSLTPHQQRVVQREFDRIAKEVHKAILIGVVGEGADEWEK